MARRTNFSRPEPRQYSPDDIKARMIEAEARRRADTRDAAARWLGDPPPDRSALAQRSSQAPPATVPPLRSRPPDETLSRYGDRRKPISRFG